MQKSMAVKDIFSDTLSYGMEYENFIGGVRDVSEKGPHITFTIYDRRGFVAARVPKSQTEAVVDGVYVFSFAVIVDDGKKTAVVSSMRQAVPGVDSYSPMDIFSGLSPEKAEYFRRIVMGCAGRVMLLEKKKGRSCYGRLLKKYLTDSEFKMLASKPASVMECGRYAGGALCLVANMAEYCRFYAETWERMGNGLYNLKLDEGLMLTAAIICMAGMRDYVDESLNKTQKGVIRGYHSLLQSRVEGLIRESQIPEREGDRLLNVVHCIFRGGGKIKGVEKEAAIVRAVFGTYSVMDMTEEYLSEAPVKEEVEKGYRFSEKLNSYFIIPASDASKEEGVG